MKDRIGMRENIWAELLWSEPSGEKPDWKVWRDSLRDRQEVPDNAGLCRYIRVSVGRK